MSIPIDADRPLTAGSALEKDRLGRKTFAKAAVEALVAASKSSGFVISIEGQWGSGKTSTLGLIEDLLNQETDKPIIVHFNPWLVGDRHALIKLFFQAVGNKINISDHSADAKKAAKAIKNYAKVFDALKLIPGAAGIAEVTKQVMVSVADTADGYATEKDLDLEGKKRELEKALVALGSRILVFIDDIDRLLPHEVLEIVRIVKAVGDLPNVGYVVAWDAEYVQQALANGQVPKSNLYLDKIVQVRLPLPAISESVRQKLLQQALDSLPPAATESYFPDAAERMYSVYTFGMRGLLEQPRDINRMMNTLRVIEPTLRGEIVLADLLGLACLMTKAPSIYERLRSDPKLFQGSLSRYEYFADDRKRQAHFKELTKSLWSELENENAIKELVFFLFPAFASACGEAAIRPAGPDWGTLAEPDRLALALAFDLSQSGVSLVAARRYIAEPEQRGSISNELDADSCVDFIEALGNLGSAIDASSSTLDFLALLVDIARLVDSSSLSDSLSRRNSMHFARAEGTASIAIAKILTAQNDNHLERRVLDAISSDPLALTFRAEMITDSMSSRQTERSVTLPANLVKTAISRLAEDVLTPIKDGDFWRTCNPSRIIWVIMRNANKQECKRIFKAFKKDQPELDKFALAFLKHSFSSNGGQSYGLPDEALVEKLVPISTLKKHARKRVRDPAVQYPLRAAWQSVVDGTYLLGKDGRQVIH